MNRPFTEAETKYLITWAIEDHNGFAKGLARTLQRQHDVKSAVLGNLFANMCLATKQDQMLLVETSVPEGPVVWPWPTQENLERSFKELLPPSSIAYLEEIGALNTRPVASESGGLAP